MNLRTIATAATAISIVFVGGSFAAHFALQITDPVLRVSAVVTAVLLVLVGVYIPTRFMGRHA